MKDKDIIYGENGSKLRFGANGFAIFPTGQNLQNAFWSGDFQNIVLTIVGTGTIVAYGSTQLSPPDFSAPVTIDNSFTPISLVEYALTGTNAYHDGATGVTVSGSASLSEFDTNLITWMSVHRSGNTVDVKLTLTNTQ